MDGYAPTASMEPRQQKEPLRTIWNKKKKSLGGFFKVWIGGSGTAENDLGYYLNGREYGLGSLHLNSVGLY